MSGSIEVFSDTDLVSQVPNILDDAFTQAESAAFTTGSGSGQPTGIITRLAATTNSKVSTTTGGVFSSGSAVDVYKIDSALPPRARVDGVSWLANRAILNTIRQMSPSAITSTTTTGTSVLALGDFSHFGIYGRAGTAIEFIPHLLGSNRRPTGTGAFYAWRRVGSDVIDGGANFRVLTL